MKHFLIAVLIVYALSSSLYCQIFWKTEEKFEKNIIVVEGETINEVPADYATFDFSVRGTGKSLRIAVETARLKVSNISKQLFGIGLKERNLATTYFSSGENYEDKAFLSSKRDYVTEITIIVGLDSLELLEPAIIAVSNSHPNTLSDIKFELRNVEQIKVTTLNSAINRAKEKAESIAKELSLDIGKAIYVEELSEKDVNYNSTNSITLLKGKNISQSIKGIHVEAVKVKAKVRVIFDVTSE